MMNVEQWSNVCGDVIGMVFFSKRRDTDVFWAHVYHRYRCDFLDLTIVVDVFRCFSYSRFLVGFLDFLRHFHGRLRFLVGFHVISRHFHGYS